MTVWSPPLAAEGKEENNRRERRGEEREGTGWVVGPFTAPPPGAKED